MPQRASAELGREIRRFANAIGLIEVAFRMADQDFEGIRDVHPYDTCLGRAELYAIKIESVACRDEFREVFVALEVSVEYVVRNFGLAWGETFG